MFDFSTIRRIKRQAIDSLKMDSDGELYYVSNFSRKLLFYVVLDFFSYIIFFLSVWLRLTLENMSSIILTSLSIFIGLFFSLLINIGQKVKKERDNKDRDHENFDRFKNNSLQISRIIQYQVLIAIQIILLFILIAYLPQDSIFCIYYVVSGFINLLIYRFLILLIAILQRFSFLADDEIENIL